MIFLILLAIVGFAGMAMMFCDFAGQELTERVLDFARPFMDAREKFGFMLPSGRR